MDLHSTNQFLMDSLGVSLGQVILGMLGILGFYLSAKIGIALWKLATFLRFGLTLWRMGIVLTTSGVLLSGSWLVSRVHQNNMYEARVNKSILAAYKSDSPEKAAQHLQTALDYLKEKGMHEGTSAVLYPSHEEDLSNYYAMLDDVKEKAVKVPTGKMDDLISWKSWAVSKGLTTTAPDGISVAPSNRTYFVWGLSGLTLFGLGVGVLGIRLFQGRKESQTEKF